MFFDRLSSPFPFATLSCYDRCSISYKSQPSTLIERVTPPHLSTRIISIQTGTSLSPPAPYRVLATLSQYAPKIHVTLTSLLHSSATFRRATTMTSSIPRFSLYEKCRSMLVSATVEPVSYHEGLKENRDGGMARGSEVHPADEWMDVGDGFKVSIAILWTHRGERDADCVYPAPRYHPLNSPDLLPPSLDVHSTLSTSLSPRRLDLFAPKAQYQVRNIESSPSREHPLARPASSQLRRLAPSASPSRGSPPLDTSPLRYATSLRSKVENQPVSPPKFPPSSSLSNPTSSTNRSTILDRSPTTHERSESTPS